MKLVKITLSVALLGLLSIASAEDTATVADTTTATVDTTVSNVSTEETVPTEETLDVDAQIETIQSASAEERVELMNQFKQRLMQMNEEERMAAIEEMQSKMHAQSGDAQQLDTAVMAQNRTKTQEHTQEMQMQTNEEALHTQTMIQQQAGSQYMQTIGTSDTISVSDRPSMNVNMMHRR